MKFAIVLLGLFALAAAAPQERGIIEDVESMVNSAISKAQADLQSLVTLVEGLVANAQANVNAIIDNAMDQFTATIAELEATMSAMIAKGGVVAQCAQTNLGQLTAFKDDLGKNVQSCAGSVQTSLGGFEGSVLAEISSLQSSVAELVAIVQECNTNPITAAICAYSKSKEVESLIQNIVSSANEAVDTARGKVGTVVAQVQTCVQQTIAEASIVLNKFTIAVQQCSN